MLIIKKSVNNITFINVISTGLIQGITFLVMPFFSRVLGPEQYGICSLFNTWVSIFSCFMGLSMLSALGPGMYEFQDDYCSFRNSIFICSLMLSIVQVFMIIILSSALSPVLGFSRLFVIMVGLASFGRYILLFGQNIFIFEKKAIKNLFLSVGYCVLMVFLSVVLLYMQTDANRYWGRIGGITISYLITAVIICFIVTKEGSYRCSWDYNLFAIRVGFPIIFHSLALNVLVQSDRVMMQNMNIEVSNIGIYSLFYSLCSVLSILLTAFNNSWIPFYYDDLNAENISILNKKCKNYIELYTCLGVGFILLSREVSMMMSDSSYWSGFNVIPILAFAIYFTFMYQFPVNFEIYNKRTHFVAIGTLTAGIINITLNYYMIPHWGMIGAALATSISYFVLFIIHFFIANNMNGIQYHMKLRFYFPGLLAMTIASILFYILMDYWYVRWGIGIVLGCFELYRIYKRKSIF